MAHNQNSGRLAEGRVIRAYGVRVKEIKGNIWDYHDKGHWIIITTNGTIKANGEAVMGRGVALQAKRRYPSLPQDLGKAIIFRGSKLWSWPEFRLMTFPTKNDWRNKSDLSLIETSCKELVHWLNSIRDFFANELRIKLEDGKAKIYMVRPGCGNGGLDWKDVKPVLEKYLDDRFIVIEKNG